MSSLSLQSEVLEEELLGGSHVVISGELNDGTSPLPTHALVDSGATGYAFADELYVRDHNLPLFKLKQPRRLEVIDGRPVESGDITHLTNVTLYSSPNLAITPLCWGYLGSAVMMLVFLLSRTALSYH